MSKGKILVVDDSPLVRRLAEVSLTEKGYKVYTSSDGEEGLRLAEQIIPDLILVDFIMPKMTGSQFCKLLTENDKLKHIPLILITGKGETVGQTFVEKYGVIDYFIKPFKSEDLIEKVESTLSKVGQQAEEYVEPISLEEKEITDEKKEIEELTLAASSLDVSEIELAKINEEKTEEYFLPEDISKEIPTELTNDLEKDLEKESEPPLEIREEDTLGDLSEIVKEVEEFKVDHQIDDVNIEIPELTESQTSEIELKIPEISEFEISEFKDDVIEKIPISEEIEDIQPFDISEASERLKEPLNGSSYAIPNIEKLIDYKFDALSTKLIDVIEESIENTLKKYEIVKPTSVILSGHSDFIDLKSLFYLIKSKSLTGVLSIYDKLMIYEFLFFKGRLVYGISNKQKRENDIKLMDDLSDEQIRNFMLENIALLKSSERGKFIFEIKEELKLLNLINRPSYAVEDIL